MGTLTRRFRLALSLTLLASLAALTAALLGQLAQSPLAVALLFYGELDQLTYEVVDIRRGLSSRQSILLPGRSEVFTRGYPLLTLQRERSEDTQEWTLSEFDVLSRDLTPVMRLTTPLRPGRGLGDVQQYGAQFSLYEGWNGAVWQSSRDQPEARLVSRTERGYRGAVWSSDWKRVVISTVPDVSIVDADGVGRIELLPSDRVLMQPRWSPDDRYILFAADTPIVDSPIPVIDAQSGAVLTELTGRNPAWCGRQIVYSADPGGGQVVLRLADPLLATDILLASVPVTSVTPGNRSLRAQPVGLDACEWFVVTTFSGKGWLLHRPTSALSEIGSGVRVLKSTADFLIFESVVNGLTEIRRVPLAAAASGPEMLARLQGRASLFRLLDNAEGGLFLYANQTGLRAVDFHSGAETVLTPNSVRAFAVIE